MPANQKITHYCNYVTQVFSSVSYRFKGRVPQNPARDEVKFSD